MKSGYRMHFYLVSVSTVMLKRVLIECWAQLILNTLTLAIDHLSKRTVIRQQFQNAAVL